MAVSTGRAAAERVTPWSGAMAADPAAVTAAVTRGVCRWLEDSGFATLREFKLGTGRLPDDKWLEYFPFLDGCPRRNGS